MSNYIYHTGGCGDIIYALPTIKSIGGGILVTGLSKERHDYLKPLLESQSYISEVRHITETGLPKGTINMDTFRQLYDGKTHLLNLHLRRFGFPDYNFEIGGWIETDKIPAVSEDLRLQSPYAIINVTPRYRDRFFKWGSEWSGECNELYVHKGVSKIFFVGDKSEFEQCKWLGHRFGNVGEYRVKFIKTRDGLHAASIIMKAKAFSGNQSMMLALRQGLGLPYRFEQAPFHVDTTQHSKHEKILNPFTRRLHRFCFGLKSAFKQ